MQKYANKEEKILCKPSGIISMSGGQLIAQERKDINVLLYYAKSALVKDPTLDFITVPLQEFKNLSGDKSTNNTQLKKRLKALRKESVEYNVLGKDFNAWGDIGILSEIHSQINKEGRGEIIFALSPTVKKNIINNFFYAKIDLLIIKDLKSKYAIILYELIKDYQNVQIPKMNDEEFKKLFGIADGEGYKKISNLRKRVLDTACKEINDNPDINYKINYQIYPDGIKFEFAKKFPGRKEEPGKTLERPVIKSAPPELTPLLPLTKELKNSPPDFTPLGDVLAKYIDKKSRGI